MIPRSQHTSVDRKGELQLQDTYELAIEKTIAAIGVSDEDVAHVRLLMRKAAAQLSNTWRWGSEVGADLVVVDVGELRPDGAVRAQATGVRSRCSATKASIPRATRVHRPLKLQHRRCAEPGHGRREHPGCRGRARHDFYSASPTCRRYANRRAHCGHDEPGQGVEDVALGLDELIRGNPLVDPFANARPPLSHDNAVGIEESAGATRRSEARVDRDTAQGVNASGASRNLLPPSRRSLGEDRTQHPLLAYLGNDLLGGPAQIAWHDEAVLTLDPKNDVFHCEAGLAALEVYCREPPRRSDWRALTSAEIAQVRQSQVAQPYSRLIWLDALLRSGGKLAGHLDPGGTYRLTRWLEIRRDYPRHSRISTVMMQPLRLHEIVVASGCDMSDVFDVVNAYDAIGWLEWTPRPPRHGDVASESGLSGIMQKLRKPFGR